MLYFSSSLSDITCPPNSEYHLCSNQVSDCAENPNPLAVKCKEGCFCKPGYFHTVGKCVPNSECGCIHNGVYHEIHESFYSEKCQLHCVCMGHDTMQCTNQTCPPGTKCSIQDGYRACHASQPDKCALFGGRHLRNYDGSSFDVDMGEMPYVLSQACNEEEPDPIIVQQGDVHLGDHGLNISLEKEHLGKAKVNCCVFANTYRFNLLG